jgi:hypothetical protein
MNLPDGLTPQDILDLMNTALVAIQGSVKSGNPIINCWMNSDQKHNFIEFRTPEETTNGLKLDGLNILGKVIILKVTYKNRKSK